VQAQPTSSGPLRVVVFSREPRAVEPDAASLPPAVELVRVTSGYEAAAEVLAGPVAAVVVDLRALTARHARLVGLARRHGAEVWAVGRLAAETDAEDLSGLRLVSRGDLPAMLSALAPAEAPAAEPPAPPAPEPAQARAAEPASGLPADRQAGRYVPASEPPRPKPAATSPAPPPPASAAAAPEPGRLLTAEELATLLENER